MRGRRIALTLPNTGASHRKRNTFYIRGMILVALGIFLLLQLHVFNYADTHDSPIITDSTNDSADAILSMVPTELHKYLKAKSRNQTIATRLLHNSTPESVSQQAGLYHPPLILAIRDEIYRYNNMQTVLNEDTFGPLQNDSVIIVVQVHMRIIYLRHLIVSLAQARDISKALLIFSHDYYDDDINDLIQTIDFCKVMQIFYPYSIQTHPKEFPGVDPNDCPRDILKDLAIIRKCNNALYPDLYGHYREAKFTQTKHHWWWKANRVFDQLEITRNHTGLVLFLEEDHYVAEDFLYLLSMMQTSTKKLCPQCNILSLGTYLKAFNYYMYNSKTNKKSFSSQYASSLISSNNLLGLNKNRNSLQLSSQSQSSLSLPFLLPSSSSSTSAANDYRNKHFNENRLKSMSMSKSQMQSLSKSQTQTKLNFKSKSQSKSFVGDTNTNAHEHIINTITATTATTTTTTTSNTKTTTTDKSAAQQTWSYHVLPSLYSVYQKDLDLYSKPKKPEIITEIRVKVQQKPIAKKFSEVEVTPWVSSKHNMGFAFNRTTWNSIRKCTHHFCTYDDYNWDWSLHYVSQQCLRNKLHAMIVKGPRVFHIGECGVHHKKLNCESNQVISKVQHVLRIALKSHQLYPRSLSLSLSSLVKKQKLRKGNGGWGDRRDRELCMNMTYQTR